MRREDDASGSTLWEDVRDDVPRSLGVPFVNLIFHELARHPAWLAATWTATHPVVKSPAFDAAASVLRALAAPADPPPPLQLPPGPSARTSESLRRLTDAYNHVQPRLLLLTAGWADGLAAGREVAPPVRGAATPVGIVDPGADVPMVGPGTASPELTAQLEDIARRRGHPRVASYYRSLASLPGVLDAVWQLVQPRVRGEGHRALVAELSAAATDLARMVGIPGCAAAAAPADRDHLGQLLTTWRDVQVPELLVDTAIIRAALAPGSSGWPPYSSSPST